MTPSVRTGVTNDVMLSIVRAPGEEKPHARAAGDRATAGAVVGGFVITFGTVLAVFPGRRRNPLDPVSAPAPIERSPGDPDDADAAGDVVVGDDDAETEVVAEPTPMRPQEQPLSRR